jgi:type IV pilus assembly protein PilX
MKPITTFQRRTAHGRQQRGVVLLFSLIALVIMLIVSVALVRSFNNSLVNAGNIGFKRDLQNQSEQAAQKVLTEFSSASGALSTAAKRKDNIGTSNYSATFLATNSEGIPDVLQSATTMTNAGFTGGALESGDKSVKITYVIDRLCAVTGDETTIGAAENCRLATEPTPPGTGLVNLRSADRTINGRKGAAPQAVLYRVSVKAIGPRKTQSFFQSTFTVPSS